jgi:hypothetical protein
MSLIGELDLLRTCIYCPWKSARFQQTLIHFIHTNENTGAVGSEDGRPLAHPLEQGQPRRGWPFTLLIQILDNSKSSEQTSRLRTPEPYQPMSFYVTEK